MLKNKGTEFSLVGAINKMTNNTRLKSVFIRLVLIIIAASLSLIYNIIVESKISIKEISIKDYGEYLAKTPNDEYEFYKWIHLEQ